MRILAIETATPASSVAIGEDGRLAAMAVSVNRRGHVGFLVPAIEYCFRQAGWRPGRLDAVAVDVGPGLFTGIRAGLASAQGVAASVGARLMGICSLDALAFRAATGRRMIWPLVDVRRQQVAVAQYRPVPGGVVRESEPELTSFERLRALLAAFPQESLVVGDWEAMPGLTDGLRQVRSGRPRYPAADVLLELAASAMVLETADSRSGSGRIRHPPTDVLTGAGTALGQEIGMSEVRPLYLRESDAVINWADYREELVWPEPE